MAEIASSKTHTDPNIAFVGSYKAPKDDTRGRKIKIGAKNLDLFYSKKQALFNVNFDVFSGRVTALIGPSGCGKSSFIRCFNRMNDLIDGCRLSGAVTLDGKDIYAPDQDVEALRAKVGMVFKNRTHFLNLYMITLPTGPAFLDWQKLSQTWMKLLLRA